MTIASISSNINSYQSNVQGHFKQRQQAFENLASALQSGDLSGARTAYATLQKLQPGRPSQSGQQGENAPDPISSDFATLGTALQSGNLADAQTAFATLQKDFQNLQPGQGGQQGVGYHHPHHHRLAHSQNTAASTGSTINVST